jgi:TetR/AcrR family transcriptional regulator, ethionamide resistance regulator
MTDSTDETKILKKANLTKGARTRAHIKQVARQLFERDGHAVVTAQAIVEAAGISSGTFYIYFANKDEVLLEICREFHEEVIAGLAQSHTGKTVYENVCLGQYAYIRRIVDNWSFYRALLSYSFAEPRLRDAQHKARIREAERTQRVLERVWRETNSPYRVTDPEKALQTAMMLNAMIEGFLQDLLREVKVGAEPSEPELREIVAISSRLFYRAAYLEDPPKD